MNFSIIKSNNKHDESEAYKNDENFKIVKENILFLILIIKIVVAAIYAFGLGYSLFFFGDNYIKVGFKFLILLSISYTFIAILYYFFKALLLPKAFDKDTVTFEFNLNNFSIDIYSKLKISKVRVIIYLIIPFIILAIIPTIISYVLGFNIYLYVLASSSAIIGSKDLIYLILIFKNYTLGNTIELYRNYIIFYK